jgi:DeoR family fructose operon transcriptional repressor
MSKQKRWSVIIETCKTHERISVEELTELLNVSPATIRRDLQEMEDLQMIERFHGGARISSNQYNEPAMVIKAETNQSEKKQIAFMAAKMIKDNQMVFIDAGSTTYEMIQYIRAKNITVVTPGVPHLSLLGSRNISTIVLGGKLRWSTEAITGNTAIRQMEDLYFDISFVGTNGIHEQIGFTTSNEPEAETKHLAITHSKHPYILTDHSKFNMLCPVQFAKLNEATIITDYVEGFNTKLINYISLDGNDID